MIIVCFSLYILGQTFQQYYEQPNFKEAYIIKLFYDEITLILFVVVLWRHYQKDAGKYIANLVVMNIEIENDII